MKIRLNQYNIHRIFSSVLLVLFGLLTAVIVSAESWINIGNDGIHDPGSPAIGILQEPAEALNLLPPDTAGNKVDWIRALQQGYIKPRSFLHEERKLETLDTDILFTKTGDRPFVLFPHKPHTEWLDCSNCHENLFKSEAGANKFNMLEILQGDYCGRCHGAVSFPLTECDRCHSVTSDSISKTNK